MSFMDYLGAPRDTLKDLTNAFVLRLQRWNLEKVVQDLTDVAVL